MTRNYTSEDSGDGTDTASFHEEISATRSRIKKHLTEIAKQHHDTAIIEKPAEKTVISNAHNTKEPQIILKMSEQSLMLIHKKAVREGITISRLIERSLAVAHPSDFYGKIKFD